MSRTAFLRAVIAVAEWARDNLAERSRWNEQIAQAYRDLPETEDERAVREQPSPPALPTSGRGEPPPGVLR